MAHAVPQICVICFTVILCDALFYTLFYFIFHLAFFMHKISMWSRWMKHSLACGKIQSRVSRSQFSVLEEFLPLCASVTRCVCGTLFTIISSARQPALCFCVWQEFCLAVMLLATHGNFFFCILILSKISCHETKSPTHDTVLESSVLLSTCGENVFLL